jgi:menaquinone-dependent protoporphyrinogen oxidase
MIRILIPYGTVEGQTARIAECLAHVIQDHGCEAHPVDIERAGAPNPASYDAVIVGASVHMGKHESSVRDFVRQHRQTLERLPSAFFSVSLAAHEDTPKARQEVQRCIDRFLQETGWRPGTIGRFAGALLYTRYGFFTRWMMKQIARSKGSPDTDTSRDYFYTDWDSVKRFGTEFLEMLVPAVAVGARE